MWILSVFDLLVLKVRAVYLPLFASVLSHSAKSSNACATSNLFQPFLPGLSARYYYLLFIISKLFEQLFHLVIQP